MNNYRVNLSFAALPDGQLDELTTSIITSMNGNPAFPNPPIPLVPGPAQSNAGAADAQPAVSTLQTNFRNAVAAAADGGVTLTAAKNAARNDLLKALRSLAAYVQSVTAQDKALMLTSGFSVSSTNRAQSKLDVPIILLVENIGATKLALSLQPVDNARAYQVRGTTGNNGTTTTLPIVDSTQARSIVVDSLVPGATYTFQARAVGGSEGHSEWSDPVSHMAM